MTDISKSILPIGTGSSIRTFLEDGTHINRKPISEYDSFTITGVIANREYTWDFSALNHDVIPLTLFGFKSTGVANNDSLIIRIRNASNNALIWEINLAGNKSILGNAFYFNFPFMVVSKNHTASVTSAVALDSFLVYGEPTYLNSPISPTY